MYSLHKVKILNGNKYYYYYCCDALIQKRGPTLLSTKIIASLQKVPKVYSYHNINCKLLFQ